MPKHVLIVAGDPSADLHGASLIRALRARDPQIRVTALGGTHLQKAADRFVFPLVALGGFGFWEPLLKLPKLLEARRLIKDILKTEKPNVVVPMDYYGFNIHTARQSKARGIPVVYYISPQVWASRPHRIQALAHAVTKMLVIFPFEEKLYRDAGLDVRFVGHPLLDQVPAPTEPSSTLTLGLFPGSRWSVAKRHIPIMINTARELRRHYPQSECVLFRPPELDESLYGPFLATNPWLRLVCDPDYKRRKTVTLAISVSGTVALENTLLGVPMIVMYKLSTLTYEIAKRLIQVPFVAIPNLLANKAIVPELLQQDAEPHKLASAARQLLEDRTQLRAMRDNLLSLRASLGQPGAAERAAEEILRIP